MIRSQPFKIEDIKATWFFFLHKMVHMCVFQDTNFKIWHVLLLAWAAMAEEREPSLVNTQPRYVYRSHHWTSISPTWNGSRSRSLGCTVKNLVLALFTTIPLLIQNSFKNISFLCIPRRVVDKRTVSSINTSKCSHCRKPSGSQLDLIAWIIELTYKTNSKQDVGEPCLTPVLDSRVAVPFQAH